MFIQHSAISSDLSRVQWGYSTLYGWYLEVYAVGDDDDTTPSFALTTVEDGLGVDELSSRLQQLLPLKARRKHWLALLPERMVEWAQQVPRDVKSIHLPWDADVTRAYA